MTNKNISRLLFVGLCIAVSLTAISISGIGQSFNSQAFNGHQAELERTSALKAIQKLDGTFESQPNLERASALKAIQKLYGTFESQPNLERASAFKAIQKMYGDHGPFGEERWRYWANNWLNSP